LKFADKKIVQEILMVTLPGIIKDFPVEIFQLKSELVTELVELCSKGTSDQEICFYSLEC
jgi:hypothetical protein